MTGRRRSSAYVATLLVLMTVVFTIAHAEEFTRETGARYIIATVQAFRSVYSTQILSQVARSSVTPEENWVKKDHSVMLPSQFVQAAGAEIGDLELGLIGLTPISRKNLPKSRAEEDALRRLLDNPKIGILSFEDHNKFVALAPDIAIAQSCVSCHNAHPSSYRKDFKKGDVMGAIVVRMKK